jgi:hypothetical protein
MARKGDGLKLYISDDMGAAVADFILVPRAGDLDVTDKRKKSDYVLRGEDFQYSETTKREFMFTTTYRRKKPGLTDAAWDLIQAAMDDNTPLLCMLLDAPKAPGSGKTATGIKGAFYVEDLSDKNPVDGLAEVSLGFTPCIADDDGVDVVIEPVSIAGS